MPFTDSETPTGWPEGEPLQQDAARSLDEIAVLLRHMLALAELSASDMPVDRPLLQKTAEHLKKEIDRIADTL